jgi:thiol-disulfide isomerase/thioredoxin
MTARFAHWAACSVLLSGCEAPPSEGVARPVTEQGTAADVRTSQAKPEILKAPRELADGRAWVQAELARAAKDQRKLVIYVGASWCEPCVRFHDAVLAGRLDRELAGVRLLELDADVHERIRGEADLGCSSRMIPLFARPTAEGRCGAERVEGAIKGDGAVGFILPRLVGLLGD